MEVVWDGVGLLTASVERDYVATWEDGDEIIHWPNSVVFDYEQLAVVCDRTSALYLWERRLPQDTKRCEGCQKRFIPNVRTARFCKSNCYTRHYQREKRKAAGCAVCAVCHSVTVRSTWITSFHSRKAARTRWTTSSWHTRRATYGKAHE